jgi:hypothetical protein
LEPELFPKILRRIANPVESLGFTFVSDSLLLSLFDGLCNGLGKQANAPNQLDGSPANVLYRIHGVFPATTGSRASFR